MAQWFEDPLFSLLWHRFDPWSRNFPLPWVWPKKKGMAESAELAFGWTGCFPQPIASPSEGPRAPAFY